MWVRRELTALYLVAHITTIVPAITLQLFADADARSAGKLIGASCSHTPEKHGAEEKAEIDHDDKLSKRE